MNGILVPRFYNTNIVYDDIPAKSILTLDTNSYSSITLQDGILAKSNNVVGFTKPTGLLYGSMNNDVWTLNSIDPPTTSENAADKTLYYSNGKYVWSELSVSSKNIQVDPPNLNGKWTNFLINESNNFTSTQASVNNYGIFNSRGNVINLDSKVLGELGFRFFSPSEINETGYITTNLILFNSSVTAVSFPVNYYNILNFHSTKNTNAGDISSNIWNLSFTKGLYNYTTTSNNLPIELNNTFTTTQQLFYNYVIDNTTTDDVYIHYTTTLDIDSVILPPSNSNYWTLVKKSDDSYTSTGYVLSDMSNYKLIIGISTNFSNIRSDTYYQNIFLCNQYTPVMSDYDLSTLLGYLIIDLKDIDADGKVNINKSLNIDSTIPFNKNTIMLSNDEFKNSIISFRPYYYIDQLNNIRSLHYNDYLDKPLIYNIKSIESIGGIQNIIFTGGKELKSDQYQYVNDKLRLTGNVCVDSNFMNIYTDSQIVMPLYAFDSLSVNKPNSSIEIIAKDTFCDYNGATLYFLGDKYIQAFKYMRFNSNLQTAYSDKLFGYTYHDNNLINVCLRTTNTLSNTTVVLSGSIYSYDGAIITGNNDEFELEKNTDVTVLDNKAIVIKDPYRKFKVNELNNLMYGNVVIPYGTYEIYNPRIDSNIVHITSNDSNIHCMYILDGKTRLNIIDKNLINILYYLSANNVYLNAGDVTEVKYNTYTFLPIIKDHSIYEIRPFIFNGDYKIKNEILIDNSENKFKKTVWGITYTDGNETTTIFNNNDASFNLLNQLSVDTSKFMYKSGGIFTKDTAFLIFPDNGSISYNEYIEITNPDYFCDFERVTDSTSQKHNMYMLCKQIYPLSELNIIKGPNGKIQINNFDDKKGSIDYAKDLTDLPAQVIDLNCNNNIFPSSNFNTIDTVGKNLNYKYDELTRLFTLNLTELNNSIDTAYVVGQQGIYKDNKFLVHYSGNSNNIIYTDEYTDFPFFDVPVEKDIKVVLNPVTKYSNLKYYKTSTVNTTYMLATYVDFKVSLCNINATLTSYIGEYPSIIN